MGPGALGWGLDVGLPVRKPEMWPQKGLEEVHYGGEGPHWAVVPMKKKT